jgi:hypothetical protein
MALGSAFGFGCMQRGGQGREWMSVGTSMKWSSLRADGAAVLLATSEARRHPPTRDPAGTGVCLSGPATDACRKAGVDGCSGAASKLLRPTAPALPHPSSTRIF